MGLALVAVDSYSDAVQLENTALAAAESGSEVGAASRTEAYYSSAAADPFEARICCLVYLLEMDFGCTAYYRGTAVEAYSSGSAASCEAQGTPR